MHFLWGMLTEIANFSVGGCMTRNALGVASSERQFEMGSIFYQPELIIPDSIIRPET